MQLHESADNVQANPFIDLDQYIGLWAVDETRFVQLLERVEGMDLAAHVQIYAGDRSIAGAKTRRVEGAQVEKAIAIIYIEGTVTKRGSSLSSAGSLIRLRQAVRDAGRDPEVGGILLVIDSPGGTVAGTADMAREVAAAARQKPVYAFAEDLMASAAYWIGSQADRIYANDATAMIGSIGTFVGLYDYSGRAEKEGIKAVVIKAGKFKGSGFEGTAITEEQQAHWQSLVDKTQAEFSAAVASGRRLGLARVNELADGRVHLAADAKTLGLIDGIQSYEQTLFDLRTAVRNPGSRNRQPGRAAASAVAASPIVATREAGQDAATFAELKAGLVGADADFLCRQLEARATLAQARMDG